MSKARPTSSKLAVRAAFDAHPLHPAITQDQISRLVDEFYDRVFADARLGPIFLEHSGEDRTAHMRTMKQFWSSVLLKTREYSGQPMPVHLKLTEVQPDDFAIWLNYFRVTSREIFESDAASIVIASAERIAESLKLAMFGSAELFGERKTKRPT